MDVIRVEGLEDLRVTLLERLPEKLRGKALQGALAQGARPIVSAARAMAPVDSGLTRRSIYSKRSKYSKLEYESRIIGVRHGKRAAKKGRDAYYWKFVEFGHLVGNKKTGYLQKRGKGSGHSGIVTAVAARPFMRPAFESQKVKALDNIRAALEGEILKVAEAAQARSGRRFRRAALGF